jgi:hypothetical protein
MHEIRRIVPRRGAACRIMALSPRKHDPRSDSSFRLFTGAASGASSIQRPSRRNHRPCNMCTWRDNKAESSKHPFRVVQIGAGSATSAGTTVGTSRRRRNSSSIRSINESPPVPRQGLAASGGRCAVGGRSVDREGTTVNRGIPCGSTLLEARGTSQDLAMCQAAVFPQGARLRSRRGGRAVHFARVASSLVEKGPW